MNKKKNNHYQTTHNLIRQTMVQLLEKENLNDITVKKICSVAKINRSTFYAHYESLYNLLDDIDSLLRIEHISELDKANISLDNYMSREGLSVILAFVYKYRNFYSQYMERLSRVDYLEEMFSDIWDTHPGQYEQTERTRMLYQYIILMSGAIKAVERWLKTGCKESADELSEIITQHNIRSDEPVTDPTRKPK